MGFGVPGAGVGLPGAERRMIAFGAGRPEPQAATRSLKCQSASSLCFYPLRPALHDLFCSPTTMPHDLSFPAVDALLPEVSALIVEALNLDVAPADINPDASLFGEGLDLDSIDVLELALVVSKRYGFKMQADDPNNETIFSSLRALAAHIANHRTV